jgi:hypothetical protein
VELPPIAPTFVMTGVSDPPKELVYFNNIVPFDLCVFGVPEGPERVVFNIAYLWPQRLYASDICRNALPFLASAKEVVFHFKKVGERIRAMYNPNGDVNPPSGEIDVFSYRSKPLTAEGLRSFQVAAAASPEAALQAQHDTWFLVCYAPLPKKSLFEQIVDLFAAVVKAGGQVPKLTMVGLEEFDLHRDVDAANDAIIDDFVTSGLAAGRFPLHKQIPPPRGAYTHPPYQPVAPTFIDTILERVDKSQRELVYSNVKLLSPAKYIAGLAHPADEDWWPRASEIPV